VFNDRDFAKVGAVNRPAPWRAQDAPCGAAAALGQWRIPADEYELRRLLDRDVDAKS
jgi:hypothetical protein